MRCDRTADVSSLVIGSFYELQDICPKSPLELIASTKLDSITGVPENSQYFHQGPWEILPDTVRVKSKPVVYAAGTDNLQKVADAEQWNFSHLTWLDSPQTAYPIRRSMFLRAGTEWINRIVFDFEGLNPDKVLLSFLNNAATRGDKQGTTPVISFGGVTFVNETILDVVLHKPIDVRMGLMLMEGASYYMFDMEWIVVP